MYKETVLKISMYYQHVIDVNKKDLKRGKMVYEPNILSGVECFQYFQRSLRPTNHNIFDFYSLRKRHNYINVGLNNL